MTLSIQALTMLHMIGAGVYLGIAFDTFSRLSWKKKNRWLILIQDILFWILNGLFIFIWIKAINEGEVRFYIFFALLCGYALYKAILQIWYLKILERLIKVIVSIYQFFLRLLDVLVIKPIYGLFQGIVALFLFIFSLFTKLLHYLYTLIIFITKKIALFFTKKWNNLQMKIKRSKEKNKAQEGDGKKGFIQWMTNWFKRDSK